MVVLSQLREREHRLLLHVVGVSAGKGERGGEREGEREGERRTPRPYQEGTVQKGAISHAISMHVPAPRLDDPKQWLQAAKLDDRILVRRIIACEARQRIDGRALRLRIARVSKGEQRPDAPNLGDGILMREALSCTQMHLDAINGPIAPDELT
jgi:hypothetical protein